MLTSLRSRSLVVVAALAVTAGLSSCSVTSKDAVRVDGLSLSNRDFDSLLSGYAEAVGGAEVSSGNINTVAARGLLQDWISTVVLEGVLAEAGIEVTDAQREAAREGLSQQPGFVAAPADVQEFYIRAAATQDAAGAAFAPSAEELEAEYALGPSESGVVCLRLILTETREDIEAAVARVRAGEDFAAVATDTSSDVSAADGGILADPQSGSACVLTSTLAEQIVPEFVSALDTAEVGETTAPFEVPGVGWVAIFVRPYDEVAEDVATVLGPATANELGRDALASADVWVNPEYGRWDSETRQIIDVDR